MFNSVSLPWLGVFKYLKSESLPWLEAFKCLDQFHLKGQDIQDMTDRHSL